MPVIPKPLTNTQVKQAKAREKMYKLSDGDGLQLKVMPGGSKSWVFNFTRPTSGKRTTIGFGSYPAVTLSDAREKRRNARALLDKHIDPKEHKDQEKRERRISNGNTFKNIASNWFEIKKDRISESTATSLWRRFDNHVFAKLGDKPISALNAPDTIAVLKPLAGKGSLETIVKLIGHINEVMVFALNIGVITTNPLAGISAAFKAPKSQNLPSLKPEELPMLMRTLAHASVKKTTRCLIEWQLHTMVRPSEASGVRWDEIDFENRVWQIPAERMKMKKAHRVPLTEQSLALLEYIKPYSGAGEFVFPADRKPKQASNPQTANMALKRMGFQNRLVAHGLRALASTTLNAQGHDSILIEASLAHVDDNEVSRAYNRTDYFERRRELMAAWSKHVEDAAEGSLCSAVKNGLTIID